MVIEAVITGSCSILAAVAAAAVTQYGWFFWRQPVKIRCEGTGMEARSIGNAEGTHALTRYEFTECVLTRRGERAEVAGRVKVYEAERFVLDASVTGAGRAEGECVYLVYEIADAGRVHVWSGLCVLRIPAIGPVVGYWMTDENVPRNGKRDIAVGAITLDRARCD